MVAPSMDGLGVFAREPIAAGVTIMAFRGPQLGPEAVAAAAATGGHDGFLQVARETYIGLSGGADDYVNHACDPNCFVAIDGDSVTLESRRAIASGEQLSFDYRLTQIAFPLRFRCRCGASACGGEIGDCEEIPLSQLAEYRGTLIVVSHDRAFLDNVVT
ncbi:MAG: SET domain-containing protein-lysine N-methyltransferase, partial [Gammaproteobacteria bacterium]